jgi:hypothetical protein
MKVYLNIIGNVPRRPYLLPAVAFGVECRIVLLDTFPDYKVGNQVRGDRDAPAVFIGNLCQMIIFVSQ